MNEYEKLVTKRLAFVCRYSSITLAEALHSETRWLMLFAAALAEIVREENRSSKGGD